MRASTDDEPDRRAGAALKADGRPCGAEDQDLRYPPFRDSDPQEIDTNWRPASVGSGVGAPALRIEPAAVRHNS